MTDMTSAITPKSDQLNADDLISGPRTIRISRVDVRATPEQPVSIFYDGDNGKPWKPCKSMSRVLVAAWGPDAKAYTGRALTLYRDPKVKWGGMEVGGIRISHMTDIEREMVMALTETKGKRAPFKVRPLQSAPQTPASPPAQSDNQPPSDAPTRAALEAEGMMAAERGTVPLQAWWGRLTPDQKTDLKAYLDGTLKSEAAKADASMAPADDGFPGD
ncbi:hypothetical protein [Brevundimonas sp. BAL450]|uniref:hypothetical protein n=1 Tax=Brevundimonas sp. BAL450 TaxID=1708162 RepID=UPI0018C989AF|nr:hypothetical protein [Brevundimonas sp. BAL450]